jgi:hypothetical protein
MLWVKERHLKESDRAKQFTLNAVAVADAHIMCAINVVQRADMAKQQLFAITTGKQKL